MFQPSKYANPKKWDLFTDYGCHPLLVTRSRWLVAPIHEEWTYNNATTPKIVQLAAKVLRELLKGFFYFLINRKKIFKLNWTHKNIIR
jgi:hypothetical protein